MEDLTILFVVGGFILLVIEYYVKSPPVYLLGEVFGIGGLYQVIQEVDSTAIDSNMGLLLTIGAIMVIIYSAMNLVNYFSDRKKR